MNVIQSSDASMDCKDQMLDTESRICDSEGSTIPIWSSITFDFMKRMDTGVQIIRCDDQILDIYIVRHPRRQNKSVPHC